MATQATLGNQSKKLTVVGQAQLQVFSTIGFRLGTNMMALKSEKKEKRNPKFEKLLSRHRDNKLVAACNPSEWLPWIAIHLNEMVANHLKSYW